MPRKTPSQSATAKTQSATAKPSAAKPSAAKPSETTAARTSPTKTKPATANAAPTKSRKTATASQASHQIASVAESSHQPAIAPLVPETAAHQSAAAHLAALHPKIHTLRVKVGDPAIESTGRTAFESLARSIVYQQLAGAAAQTIWGRVIAVTGTPINPERLSKHDDAVLRACGLSNAKLRALRDLSERAPALKLASIQRASDAEIIARLTEVRGIGVWTAQMFLMFHLGRLDVWPTADLGVREGYRRMFGLAERPTEKELLPLGAPFQPYRSVAAWYMWRAVEVLPP